MRQCRADRETTKRRHRSDGERITGRPAKSAIEPYEETNYPLPGLESRLELANSPRSLHAGSSLRSLTLDGGGSGWRDGDARRTLHRSP